MQLIDELGQPCRAGGGARSGQRGPTRARHTEGGQSLAHDDLVLGLHEGAWAGVNGGAAGDELGQEVVGHVLVLEGENRCGDEPKRGGRAIRARARDEVADRLRVARGPDGRVGEHLGRGRVDVFDEDAQVHSEFGCCGHHHAGQLTAANDGHDRRAAVGCSARRGGGDCGGYFWGKFWCAHGPPP